MRRICGIAAGLSLILCAAQASAQTFEQAAEAALPIAGARGLSAVFWSHTAKCAKMANDHQRRQCEGVVRARRGQVGNATYLVKAANTVTTLPYDVKRKKLPVAVRACVWCDEPVSVGDVDRFVVGVGNPSLVDGAIQAPALVSTTRSFADQKAATKWRQSVVPRLKTEFLIRLPARVGQWSSGGKSAMKVKVVGYRVYDGCDGKILYAQPKSSSVHGDPSLCPKEKVAPKPVVRKRVVRKPTLPAKLSPSAINTALAPARAAAQACFDTYSVEGTATFRMAISNTGELLELTLEGDFKDTPTGTCVENAVRASKFPRTLKERTVVTYPISVR